MQPAKALLVDYYGSQLNPGSATAHTPFPSPDAGKGVKTWQEPHLPHVPRPTSWSQKRRVQSVLSLCFLRRTDSLQHLSKRRSQNRFATLVPLVLSSFAPCLPLVRQFLRWDATRREVLVDQSFDDLMERGLGQLARAQLRSTMEDQCSCCS